MQEDGRHHVAHIDDTVTAANVHERAEAIAVPDFDYVQQGIDAVVSGFSGRGHRSSGHADRDKHGHRGPNKTNDRER